MKRYVRSATLDELEEVVRGRLSVPGVSEVVVLSKNSRYMSCKLKYSDGSESTTFTVRYTNKPDRASKSTDWNPEWSIQDDGKVVDNNGQLQGYFKLLKKMPQSATANYQEDSIIVDYGTRKIELTPSSGSKVAKVVK